MNPTRYGSKYDRNLDITTIAKLVRKDIRAAVKAGALPFGLKCSVRIQRYSGGQSIRVKVTAGGEGFRVQTVEFLRHDITTPISHFRGERLTSEALSTQRTIEGILRAYNFDGSDSQSDYFHVNFYGSVAFDVDVTNGEFDEVKAEIAAERRVRSEAACDRIGARIAAAGPFNNYGDALEFFINGLSE